MLSNKTEASRPYFRRHLNKKLKLHLLTNFDYNLAIWLEFDAKYLSEAIAIYRYICIL